MTTASPARPDDVLVSTPVSPIPAATGAAGHRLKQLATGAVLLLVGCVVGAAVTYRFVPAPTPEVTSPGSTPPPEADGGTLVFGPEKQSAAGVEVASVTSQPFASRVWRSGRIALDDDHLAHVCPPAEGVVREVPVRLGQVVPAGATLAVIDSRELGQAKWEAHKAKIALLAEQELSARTRTTMANADELLKLLHAETPLVDIEKRMADKPIGDWRQQLLGAYARRNQIRAQLASQQAAGGAVSEVTLRKTEAEADAAGAAYTSLVEELRFQVKHQVRQAELKLKEAETVLDAVKAKLLMFGLSVPAIEKLDPVAEGAAVSQLTVTAPFAGVVVEKHAVRSERVGPLFQMFVLADLSDVWIQADVFESDLPLVRELGDREVVFRSVAAGVPEQKAKVVYTGDLIDKATRSLTLTAEATNAERLLKPGMFVEVGFDDLDRTPVPQVPASAVLRHENKPFVFVQTAADRFRKADVTLGRTSGDRVEIVNGVRAGDRVVVRGGFVLKSELLKDLMAGE